MSVTNRHGRVEKWPARRVGKRTWSNKLRTPREGMSEGGAPPPQAQPHRAPDVAVPALSSSAAPATAASVAAVTSVSTSMGMHGLAPGSVPLTSQMMGTGLTFTIPMVSSDSVAALARHAHLIAAQLREIEARAALTALHSQLPAQSVDAAGAPATSAPTSQHDKGTASLLYASVLGGAEKARQGGKRGGAPVSSTVAILPGQPATSAVAADADDASDASDSGGIKMRSKEGDADKGSHEVRKKNDRDKKRRKRNRIGTHSQSPRSSKFIY